MISGNAGSNDACSLLADAGSGEVCCIAVQALGAAVIILIDAGIVKKAFVAQAGADNALPVLTICIVRALCIAFAAVHWVTFELFFRQTHRICVGAAINHASIASIGALSLIASGRFGGFLVGADGAAITAVIWIVAMNVDANVLICSRTKRFFRILARRQDTLSINTFLEFRTGRIAAARYVCTAEVWVCHGIDTGTAANHFTWRALELPWRIGTAFVRFRIALNSIDIRRFGTSTDDHGAENQNNR